MNKTAGRVYVATEYITKFAYLNLLWIGFSLLGLVVLGFFPATIAMFTIIRKWLMGEMDTPIFSTFWTTYKAEFLRSNGLGYIMVVVGGLIVLDLVFMRNSGSNMMSMVQIPLYMFMFAAVMTMFYLFPVYVHYELKLTQMIKNSFLMMLISPLENLVIITGLAAVVLVGKFLPGLAFFFGGSLSAAIIMAACFLVFNKMEKKQQSQKQN
ncbi:YesL family protein [Mesobacillus maritimus]|uniref:YesL family protein n=1 Tax=Mesobacillus maritimus TaxID=1643336 RepID=UPI00204015D8|nr:YesL family protein [Mesobacillus maritimus]MCM3587478.1 YesL family protein [Mesobacillus maritimus]MCM3671125.1 YesL family protein [Mesobacillus maritimus]